MEKKNIYEIYLKKNVFLVIEENNHHLIYNGVVVALNDDHIILDDKKIGLTTLPLARITKIELRDDEE